MKNLVFFDDPKLIEPSSPIVDFNDKVKELERELMQTLLSSFTGIGLAAPQIGENVRAFAYNVNGLYGVIFNPVITYRSKRETVGKEGCLSIPGFFWDISRHYEIKVEGCDSSNVKQEFKFKGLTARLFQHETDHLDGLLMFDRIRSPKEKNRAIRKAQELYLKRG